MNPGCGCEIAWFPTEAEAREAWNTRAPSPGITEGERDLLVDIALKMDTNSLTFYMDESGGGCNEANQLRVIAKAKETGEVG